MEVIHRIEGPEIRLGMVVARGVEPGRHVSELDEALEAVLTHRRQPLVEEEDRLRRAVRDMLRYGSYKPTGRGKPASEYLLRAVQQGDFPRINAVVDVNNLVSLTYLLPISLWDLERAGTSRFLFRRGRKGEAFVFNRAGQQIDVADLAVGCRLRGEDDLGEPIVNPVRDALETKTTPETRQVAAAVYAPALVEPERLEAVCQTFARWLQRCGRDVRTAIAVLEPGETAVLP